MLDDFDPVVAVNVRYGRFNLEAVRNAVAKRRIGTNCIPVGIGGLDQADLDTRNESIPRNTSLLVDERVYSTIGSDELARRVRTPRSRGIAWISARSASGGLGGPSPTGWSGKGVLKWWILSLCLGQAGSTYVA